MSYRKDDRAMRYLHVHTENFPESLSMLTATYAEIFNGLLFQSILWMCVQNLKFVVVPIPEVKRRTEKICTLPGYAHATISPKFFMVFCSDWLCECTCQMCSL